MATPPRSDKPKRPAAFPADDGTLPHLWLRGRSGPFVAAARKQLARALADEWADEPGQTILARLAKGKHFDEDLESALRHWQAGVGLIACGVLGPCSRAALGLVAPASWPNDAPVLYEAHLRPLFPSTKPTNLARYVPYVKAALAAFGLTDAPAVSLAMACMRAQAEGFVPRSEEASHLNTAAGGAPFGLCEPGKPAGQALGNHAHGDGALFKGRGFTALRGRAAYQRAAQALDLPELLSQPSLANSPEAAAVLLAWQVHETLQRPGVRACLLTCLGLPSTEPSARTASRPAGSKRPSQRARPQATATPQDWHTLCQQATGNTHALDRFQACLEAAGALWLGPPSTARVQAAGIDDTAPPPQSGKVKKDPPDLRDRPYLPPPVSLAPVFPAEAGMASLLADYTAHGLILDQGTDGACTGFGLACVVNFLRWRRHRQAAAQASTSAVPPFRSVSARMLYTMARRHDEYAGEDYEGSSCRGALKGFHRHGACLDSDWGNGPEDRPALGYARRATQNTLGVYYRVPTDSITDMQAAIHETGAVYASVWVHGGWQQRRLGKRNEAVPTQHADLPRIPFSGVPSRESGHAIALVGYNAEGFVVQNSWGTDWGRGGFAVLRYADWLSNALDAWVVALGVPGVVGGRIQAALPPEKASTSGKSAASQPAGLACWSTQQALDHTLLVGLDGRISRYMTEDVIARNVQHQVFGQANHWFRQHTRRQAAGSPLRLVLRAHSAWEDQPDAVKMAQSWGTKSQSEGAFPLYLYWYGGLQSRLNPLIDAAVQQIGPQATHRQIETALREGLGRAVWMDTHAAAQRLFEPTRAGDHLLRALAQLQQAWGERFKIELEGDGPAALVLGHLLTACRPGLLAAVQAVKLRQPAASVGFANLHFGAHPSVLAALQLETAGPPLSNWLGLHHGLRLLPLIAHALEADRRTPLIGMAGLYDANSSAPTQAGDGSSSTCQATATWLDSIRSRADLAAASSTGSPGDGAAPALHPSQALMRAPNVARLMP